MRRRYLGILMICMFALALASPAPAKNRDDQVTDWSFDVYLNDKRIGTHDFVVSETAGSKLVSSTASFRYKILFFSAFSYDHSAAERWRDDCLVRVDANTKTNGKYTEVLGEQTDAGFLVTGGNDSVELQDCVMTFAYWNPDFLGQPRLLNPQTGEYVDVNVEKTGDEMITVRGQSVAASRFQLTADDIDITLWYSADNEWLSLQSVVRNGHIIRYELS